MNFKRRIIEAGSTKHNSKKYLLYRHNSLSSRQYPNIGILTNRTELLMSKNALLWIKSKRWKRHYVGASKEAWGTPVLIALKWELWTLPDTELQRLRRYLMIQKPSWRFGVGVRRKGVCLTKLSAKLDDWNSWIYLVQWPEFIHRAQQIGARNEKQTTIERHGCWVLL